MKMEGVEPFDPKWTAFEDLYLDKYEWLEMTLDSEYPAVPPNVFEFTSNPNSGDIVIAFGQYYVPNDFGAKRGHHISLSHTDTLVPILVRGPIENRFSSEDPIWLHELLGNYVPELDLKAVPGRDASLVEFGFSNHDKLFELAVSPAYRIKTGFTNFPNERDFWLAFDIHRSFLTRLWVGPTLTSQGLGWQSRFELSLDRLKWEYRYHNKLEDTSRLSFGITDSVHVFYSSRGMLGLTTYF